MLPVYFAQKAFVLCEDKLLAVRRASDDDLHPLLWEVPGGRLNEGEELEQHLVREVFEETGIEVEPGEPFFLWKWKINKKETESPDTIVGVARLCSAKTTRVSTQGRVEEDTLDLVEWIPIRNLHNHNWIPNMRPVLQAFLLRIHCEATIP